MRNASLLTKSVVILVGALATARGDDRLKTERFDRDPGWDSHNNLRDPKLADTLKYTTKIDSFGMTYEWRIEYDPKAADGKGELKVTLGGETAVLTLTAEARGQNAELDRFGLAVYEGGGQWSKVFLDDLEYTVGSK